MSIGQEIKEAERAYNLLDEQGALTQDDRIEFVALLRRIIRSGARDDVMTDDVIAPKDYVGGLVDKRV